MGKENETTNVAHGCSVNMVVTDPRQEGLNIVKGQSVESIRKYLKENLSVNKAIIDNKEADWKKYIEAIEEAKKKNTEKETEGAGRE